MVNMTWFNSTSQYKDNSTIKSLGITSTLTVNAANTAPEIFNITVIGSPSPTESTFTDVDVNFTVSDIDGVGTIDNATVNASIRRPANSNYYRYNTTCIGLGTINSTAARYQCKVKMWYFDTSSIWDVNASAQDTSGSIATIKNVTIDYQSLTAFVLSPNSITWPQVLLGETNTTANNDPMRLNNTGNKNITQNNVNITGYDLPGLTDATVKLGVGNFTVRNVTGGSPLTECLIESGTRMANNTKVNLSYGQILTGNNSNNLGNESLYFCLTLVPSGAGLTQQVYSTNQSGILGWIISIF